MKFDLPRNLPPGSYELKATVGFGDAAVQEDCTLSTNRRSGTIHTDSSAGNRRS